MQPGTSQHYDRKTRLISAYFGSDFEIIDYTQIEIQVVDLD